MHRLILAALLLPAVLPIGASAASWPAASPVRAAKWQSFSDRKLGFSFRFPQNWRLTGSNLTTISTRGISLMYQGTATYALTASILSMAPGRSLSDTLGRFVAEQQRARNTLVARAHWSRTRLGGIAAMVAIAKNPPTEGGVSVSNAVYVTQWRGHVYEITLFSNQRPAPSSLRQFPAIYGQILSTWRFI